MPAFPRQVFTREHQSARVRIRVGGGGCTSAASATRTPSSTTAPSQRAAWKGNSGIYELSRMRSRASVECKRVNAFIVFTTSPPHSSPLASPISCSRKNATDTQRSRAFLQDNFHNILHVDTTITSAFVFLCVSARGCVVCVLARVGGMRRVRIITSNVLWCAASAGGDA